MSTFYKRLRNWCNANQGLLALLALIVAIISAIPFGKFSSNSANSFLLDLRHILGYKLQLPVYVLVVLSVALFLYIIRLKSRYNNNLISKKILIGTWKNEWTINGETNSEILVITKDFKYFLNSEHIFNVEKISYNEQNKQIRFLKVGVRPGDKRRALNELKVINNELLEGIEDNHQIRYTKISN